MKLIERSVYLKKIEPYVGKHIIKVLVDARRVGKTTILRQISKRIKKNNPQTNIIYINRSITNLNLSKMMMIYMLMSIQRQKKMKEIIFLLMKYRKLNISKRHYVNY